MIGILPAAGEAARLHGLHKALLPIPPHYLLLRHVEMMQRAVTELPEPIYIGANRWNYEQLAYHCGNAHVYHAINHDTMTETVLSVKGHGGMVMTGKPTIFGLPDTYIEDDQCYVKLAQALESFDVAVGVFVTRNEQQRSKLGMCDIENGALLEVIDKPAETDLVWAWGALAWKPVFWDYLKPEYSHVGYALNPAIKAGLKVGHVYMNGGFWDCGTESEYFDLITHLHTEKV